MSNAVKLYINSVNNFRINRTIRTIDGASRVIRDLVEKLNEAFTTNWPNDYGSIRLKVSLRFGDSPYLSSRIYWLINKDTCMEALTDLQGELYRLVLSLKKSRKIKNDTDANGARLYNTSLTLITEIDELINLSEVVHKYTTKVLNRDAQKESVR